MSLTIFRDLAAQAPRPARGILSQTLSDENDPAVLPLPTRRGRCRNGFTLLPGDKHRRALRVPLFQGSASGGAVCRFAARTVVGWSSNGLAHGHQLVAE
jgi:hypothetical protein